MEESWKIFSVIPVGPRSQDTEDRASTKLFLEQEYSLPGTVTDLRRVKILNSKSGGEAILLAFRNAKLSLIEWDPERHGISTISIHYYERDDLTCSPWVPDLSSCGSILDVEPSSRCAVFNFGIRNLAIIPFHQPGDDLVMDDYDSDLDERKHVDQETTRESPAYATPYASSFVLPLTAFDPSILHPISLAFLHEYREPTFGILYSQVATSNALLHERKDVVFYSVFTLDLEQRASTTLLSVARLPSDLFHVVALPPPVGGSLLIGSNELVHVDQAGKTNAVGVNEFSRQVSAFSMTDQSDLALRLEGCRVERLADNSGDMILILSTGNMVLIKFKLDGRSVSGISVHPVPAHAGGDLMKSAASSSAFLGNGEVFLGSEDADSLLLGWSDLSSGTKRLRSHKNDANDSGDVSDDNMSDDDVYEDDLYSTSPDATADGRRVSADPSSFGLYSFRINDRLLNIAPLRDITLGKPSTFDKDRKDNVSAELELVASQGSDRNGGLIAMRREIDPEVLASFTIDSANCVWTACVESSGGKDSHQYVIVSKQTNGDKEETEIFRVDGLDLKPIKAPEVNPNEEVTIDVGTLAKQSRVVQVLKNEVRCYDADLGLAQIYPVWDEDTSDEHPAVSASVTDPYVAILRDDSTLLLLRVDDSGDVDEVEMPDDMAAHKWLSSCLYLDKTGVFAFNTDTKGSRQNDMLLFLLGQDCRLFIYRLPDLVLVSTIDGVDCLPPLLSSEPPKRSTTRETLAEVVVADLGDTWSSVPYLIVRTRTDEITMYKPFVATSGLCFAKRFSSVFMPGMSAGFVLKTSASLPHLIRMRGAPIQCLDAFNSPSGSGFIFLDSKNVLRMCQLPRETHFDYQWPMRRIPIGEQIDHLAYSASSETYVLGTSHRAEWKLPDDDELHPEWRNEVISFLPEVDQSSLKVVTPKTWEVIDSYPLGPAEHIMAMKNISLEVSENTHERKEMIVVGTAFTRGEDIAARGCVYVFEVIKVVPEPDKPETDRKLKLVGMEPVKGAVTALSGIGGQGFLIVAQGQKCIVRGLKEDGSLLPVAFMDVQCYVSVVKELKGTGMCILGDAVKGLCLRAQEEPYKMSLFAKDLDYLDVLAADFLPDGRKLYVVVADGDCNLHVLQYDPEDPKSSNGDRLLSRSRFHTGNFASTLTLLPRTTVSSEQALSASADAMDMDLAVARHNVLITSQNGSVALVTCIAEEVYRRLSALQSQLTNTLEHACGLNPRAFRAVESDGSAGRGMLDGNLLAQWLDLSKQRRVEIASRVGADEWEIKADLESISGDGLGYL
ncbi:hypothetical protein HFD88_006928 [Aspergillus terreus]|nr:hypothetical protein HFD88_006928 [Aspergillus terreus]